MAARRRPVAPPAPPSWLTHPAIDDWLEGDERSLPPWERRLAAWRRWVDSVREWEQSTGLRLRGHDHQVPARNGVRRPDDWARLLTGRN